MALVTCIMPTYNRRRFVPRAIACFLAQDFADAELLIVDDGTDSVADLVPANPKILYVRMDGPRLLTGQKRNACCELARGEIIAHWDDDDWSAPERLSDQVARLSESGKAVTGYHSLIFWDERSKCAYRYAYGDGYALGTSQMYRKSWWQSHPFQQSTIGEDTAFSHEAHRAGQLCSSDGTAFIVATIHAMNTSEKSINSAQFYPLPATALPAGFLQ